VIDRRAFMEGIALAVLVAPRAAGADAWTGRSAPRIGVLGEVNPIPWTVKTSLADVVPRWAGEDVQRLPGLAAELVARDVDVIVTVGAAATRAASRATRSIPLVFVAAGDPVAERLVASVSRPGGNVTGLRLPSDSEVARRRLGVLAGVVPRLDAVAALAAAENPASAPALGALARAAATRGMRVHTFTVGTVDDVGPAFAAMTAAGAGAVVVVPDTLFAVHAEGIVALAATHRLPALYPARSFAEVGGLLALHGDTGELVRRTAALVARVLAGAPPATLPVESLETLPLTVNLGAARRLGLAAPRILARAVHVIG
jgi:putative ABC transport system substrate-binding protein